MGWSVGYDERWKRWIGYGVPSVCDYPECNEEIDRGLGYVCGYGEPHGGEKGCGLYFCSKHGGEYLCSRCLSNEPPFRPKEDVPLWVAQMAIDPSWKEWRVSNGLPEPEISLVSRFLAMEHDQ
jgi:hypothetical protein